MCMCEETKNHEKLGKTQSGGQNLRCVHFLPAI